MHTRDASRAFVSNIRRLNSPTAKALFSLELPSGTIIHHCMLRWSKDSRTWHILPPRIPFMGEDGSPLRDARGKIRFDAAMSFKTTYAREHFEYSALQALRQACPDLFVCKGVER